MLIYFQLIVNLIVIIFIAIQSCGKLCPASLKNINLTVLILFLLTFAHCIDNVTYT